MGESIEDARAIFGLPLHWDMWRYLGEQRQQGHGIGRNADFLLGQYFELRERSAEGSQPHLSVGLIRDWEIRLPPFTAHAEILRRVKALFALADKIEARAQAATARVEKITQSILAKAFRGELVPTEAHLARQEGRDYEPASALLARIRAEQESQKMASPRPRRRGTSSTVQE